MVRSVLLLLGLCVLYAQAYQNKWYHTCGKSKYSDAGSRHADSHIIGGTKVREYELPWQVSLRWSPGEDGDYHYCGGIIVHPEWVVTAAHCMIGVPTWSLVPVMGEHNSMDPDNSERIIGEMETYFVHDRYSKEDWFDSDIAIVKLKEPIKLNENVVAACAPNPNSDYAKERAVVSGFGTTVEGEWRPAYTLLYVNLPLMTNEVCLKEHNGYGITDTMICAGNVPEHEKDACQGDSGGPLVVKGSGDLFELVGIVSWGYGCADGPPGVYSRVPHFVDWVADKINNY